MALECDRAELPRFVALQLNKLPPVSVDCIDVSALMRKQQLMEMEMSQMKTTIDDILKVSVETSKRVETALSRPVASRASPAATGLSADSADARHHQPPSGAAASPAGAPSADWPVVSGGCRPRQVEQAAPA